MLNSSTSPSPSSPSSAHPDAQVALGRRVALQLHEAIESARRAAPTDPQAGAESWLADEAVRLGVALGRSAIEARAELEAELVEALRDGTTREDALRTIVLTLRLFEAANMFPALTHAVRGAVDEAMGAAEGRVQDDEGSRSA